MSVISLSEAQQVIDAGLAQADSAGVLLSISVVDPRGDLIAMARMDGALWRTPPLSRGKALASACFGRSSGEMTDNSQAPFMRALMEQLDGNFIPGLARNRLEGLLRVSQGPWYGEVRGDHVGQIRTRDDNEHGTAAKQYTLWDIRTGLSGQRVGNIEVAPFVSLTNVFNEVYSAAVAVNAFGGRFFEPGPRRAFSAGLSAMF